MFPLIESIKVLDGKLQHLSYHQHRFEASYYKLYKKLTNIRLNNVIQVPEAYQQGLVKLRFLYNESDCFCQYSNYQPVEIKQLKLVFSDEIDYNIKWVDRSELEKLKKQKETADDILIVKNQRITDTSFSNIIFYNGNRWVTPKFPLLHGTARARLLNEKKIVSDDIFVDDLLNFTQYKLINAMRDFDSLSLSIDTII